MTALRKTRTLVMVSALAITMTGCAYDRNMDDYTRTDVEYVEPKTRLDQPCDGGADMPESCYSAGLGGVGSGVGPGGGPSEVTAPAWSCTYSITYNDDWHDDVLCSNGSDSERPYLRDWDTYVTYDEIRESAREYEAQLNG